MLSADVPATRVFCFACRYIGGYNGRRERADDKREWGRQSAPTFGEQYSAAISAQKNAPLCWCVRAAGHDLCAIPASSALLAFSVYFSATAGAADFKSSAVCRAPFSVCAPLFCARLPIISSLAIFFPRLRFAEILPQQHSRADIFFR